jgi:hypothetical protein
MPPLSKNFSSKGKEEFILFICFGEKGHLVKGYFNNKERAN